jgi:two-component system chemotaxis sensor kinase CheA
LREHIEAFNRELLALERGGNDAARAESIKTLFRTAHSLKGAARAVSASKLEQVCHKLEEVLQGLREGSRPLTPDVFELLFSAVDTFEEAGREIAASLPAPADPASAKPPSRPSPQPVVAKSTPASSASTPDSAPAAAPASSPAQSASSGPRPEPPPSASERAAQTAFDSAANAPIQPALMPSGAFADVASDSQLPTEMPSTASGPSPSEPATGNFSLSPVELPAGQSETPANVGNAETFLRIPEHKLDSLLAGNSELLIARRRLDARQADLAALRDRASELRASVERPTRRVGGVRRRGNAVLRLGTHGVPQAVDDAQREELRELARSLETYAGVLAEDLRSLERAAQAVDERIHQVRMLPFEQACDALPRTVRDLAARERKPTELAILGGDIELDRSIVDGLRAPLLHLVRNAVDHGIESADERSLAGKAPRARITVAAALRGDRVEVTVRDDGRGIDLERVRERLRQNGMPAPSDDQEALRMIFEAGFSTARIVTDVSGRGVGLDVVRSQIEGLRGNVSVAFEPGKSTCFSLVLPLTVTTLRALLLRTGNELFAIPSANVEKLLRAAPSELAQVQGRESLLTSAAPLPVVTLGEIVGADPGPPMAAGSKLPIVVVGQPGERIALAVDELIAEQDVVVKSLGKRIRKLRHVSGATLLPSGRVALLLHAGEILRTALGRVPARRAAGMFEASLTPVRKRILLVDDSATTRTLEKSILEAAGFEVVPAVDGAQAWTLLQEGGADLVVSDVEMPNMTGFALVQAMRSSKRFRDLPVILLTSLESESDRARGLESGADAYLVKSAFDQSNLLDTIRQLL